MGGGPDLDAWLEKIRGCEVLAEDELKLLCEFVRVLGCAGRKVKFRRPGGLRSGTVGAGDRDLGGGVECTTCKQSSNGVLRT
jgi:hypothetical protein